MAKDVLKLNDFSGGLNTSKAPRDIENNQLVQAENVNVSQVGLVKSSGIAQEEASWHPANVSSSASAGTGMFIYKHDYSSPQRVSQDIDDSGFVNGSSEWDSNLAPTAALTFPSKYQFISMQLQSIDSGSDSSAASSDWTITLTPDADYSTSYIEVTQVVGASAGILNVGTEWSNGNNTTVTIKLNNSTKFFVISILIILSLDCVC